MQMKKLQNGKSFPKNGIYTGKMTDNMQQRMKHCGTEILETDRLVLRRYNVFI